MVLAVDILRLTLRKAMSDYGKIDAIYISTSDGNPICAVTKTKVNAAEASVVSSVMSKLGNLGVLTLDKGELEVVYIKAKKGYVFVRNTAKDTVMTVSTKKNVPIGLILFNIEDLAEKVSEVLRIDQAEAPMNETGKQLAEIAE